MRDWAKACHAKNVPRGVVEYSNGWMPNRMPPNQVKAAREELNRLSSHLYPLSGPLFWIAEFTTAQRRAWFVQTLLPLLVFHGEAERTMLLRIGLPCSG
jgi:hypothetical protein